MTSRRLNLHLESRGSLRDKNFGEFRSKTTFTFCENHKKLSNLPLSPHSILQNWVDYLKVTSLRDNFVPNQSGRPCLVGHSYTRESTDKNSWVFPEGAFLWGVEEREWIYGQGWIGGEIILRVKVWGQMFLKLTRALDYMQMATTANEKLIFVLRVHMKTIFLKLNFNLRGRSHFQAHGSPIVQV